MGRTLFFIPAPRQDRETEGVSKDQISKNKVICPTMSKQDVPLCPAVVVAFTQTLDTLPPPPLYSDQQLRRLQTQLSQHRRWHRPGPAGHFHTSSVCVLRSGKCRYIPQVSKRHFT